MEYDKSRIGIAYVDGKKERRQNKDKYKKLESDMSCCSLQYIQYLLQMKYKKSQKYVHSEILFCYGKNSNVADSYGVYEASGVTRQQREFTNPSYKFIFLNVTLREFDMIHDFCKSQLGKDFDYTAASWRLLIYPPKCKGNKWWCASYVHAALKKIGLLRDYRLNTLDNDDLISLLRKSNRICSGLNPGDFKNVTVWS